MTLSPIRTTLNRIYKRRLDAWEQELVVRTTNRVVRPFEWGLEWIKDWPCAAQVERDGHDPATYLRLLNQAAAASGDEFFGYERPKDFRLKNGRLRFTSAIASPYPENNTVHGQW